MIIQAGGGNIAGLGKVWSHCINTRLVFEFANESNLYYLANTANIPITTQLKKLTIAKVTLNFFGSIQKDFEASHF